MIVVSCAIGAYAIQNAMFDIWLMLGFGVVGYVFKKIGIPLAPFTLALVLGNRAEDAFRLSMIGAGGDLRVFWSNGLVGSITTLAIVLLFWPVIEKVVPAAPAGPMRAMRPAEARRAEETKSRMSRETAVARAEVYFDSGDLKRDLARRVAMPTESQNPARAPVSRRVSRDRDEAGPREARVHDAGLLHEGEWPFLFAERHEEAAETTVFSATAMATSSAARRRLEEGLSPWPLTESATRCTAAASSTTRASTRSTSRRWRPCSQTRGKLGFNAKWLIEMGEETGSPGLRELCAEQRELLRAPTC